MNKEEGIYVHGKKIKDLTEVEKLRFDILFLEQEKEIRCNT